VKRSLAANDNQIDRTLEVWRPRVRPSLTADDARQFAANVTGFFTVLAEWQIWISQGPQRTPCKIVITYKGRPSQPQFSATFTDWDFAPRIAPSAFTAELPSAARKVPFATVGGAQ
jgi:hypothetical protein